MPSEEQPPGSEAPAKSSDQADDYSFDDEPAGGTDPLVALGKLVPRGVSAEEAWRLLRYWIGWELFRWWWERRQDDDE